MEARNGHVFFISSLKARVNVNARNHDGNKALIWAARYGYTSYVKTLIDAGADVNARSDFYGYTALMWATRNRHEDCITVLTRAINSRFEYPIY